MLSGWILFQSRSCRRCTGHTCLLEHHRHRRNIRKALEVNLNARLCMIGNISEQNDLQSSFVAKWITCWILFTASFSRSTIRVCILSASAVIPSTSFGRGFLGSREKRWRREYALVSERYLSATQKGGLKERILTSAMYFFYHYIRDTSKCLILFQDILQSDSSPLTKHYSKKFDHWFGTGYDKHDWAESCCEAAVE